MYEIQRGDFPFSMQRGRPRASKYPFQNMSVGDSFFVPTSDKPSATVRQAAHNYAVRWSVRFSCKLEGDGIRVTMVA